MLRRLLRPMKINLNNLLEGVGDVALRRRARWLISNMNLENGDKILDVGCGDGFYLYLLSHLNLKLTLYGVDYDKNALDSATKNLDLSKIKLVQADLMKRLPFLDEFFDGIVMSEVMEHLPEDIKCMKEVRRVLKKNGRLVLSVPHINYPLFWDPINWVLERCLKKHIKEGFWAGIWNQHVRLYSIENLRFVLKKSGFRNINSTKLTHFSLPFNHHLINLGARILSNKNMPFILKKKVSKFTKTYRSKTKGFNPFWLVFKIDNLNDRWNGKGSAVSLVAVCEK